MFSSIKISERSFVILYLSSIALFNTLLGIQGFNMCDGGWSLVGFQQIFNDPKSVQYLFLYYLSEYVGGIWNLIFGNYGILAFRMLTVLCVTTTSYIVYKMLRPYFNRWCIFAGIFWIQLCTGGDFTVFYHNYLTALLSVCASFCLLKALLANNSKLIFISGMLIGINVFTRLPNLSLIVLILVLIPYYIDNKNKKDTLIMLRNALIGFATGIIMIIILMLIFKHYNIFVLSLKDGFSAVNDSKSTHNSLEMFRYYINSYIDILKNIALTITIPAIAYISSQWDFTRHLKFLLYTIAILTYIIMLRFTTSNVITLYAISTFYCIYILFSKKYAINYRYLSYIIIINMYAIPLGSDNGIGNMGPYCIYLSGPAVVGISHQWFQKQILNKSHCHLLILCISVFIAIVTKRGIQSIISHCYFDDNGYRWDKTYMIDNPLATTYTTKRNCELLNPMLYELAKYVKKDDYILCFQNLATIHFLTRTRPYLCNPWVWTYDPSNMERKFLEAEKAIPNLPLVVRDKSTLIWHEYYPDWNNENAKENYFHKNKKIVLINRFLKKHKYKIVWENEVFQILLPPSFEQ